MHALHYNIQYKGIHLEKWETILAKPFFQKKKKRVSLSSTYFAFLICWSPLVRALGISRTVG